MMYVGIFNAENVNSLPNSVGIMTRQDTKMWLFSYMENITFFSRIDHSALAPKINREYSSWVKQPKRVYA